MASDEQFSSEYSMLTPATGSASGEGDGEGQTFVVPDTPPGPEIDPSNEIQGGFEYPDIIQPMGASGALNNALGEYDAETQDELIERLASRGSGMLDQARGDEQQEANFPYQNWNLARNNPRGNLNNAGFNATLRFSRLADRLNNRLYWNPGETTGVFAGGQQLMGGRESSIDRWEPIETQEMRQMRANERLDERARQAQIDLQARIQEYPQELQELKDKTVMALTDYVMRSEDNIYRFWQQLYMNTEYRGTFEQFIQMRWVKYVNDLQLGRGNAIGRFLLNQSESVGNLFSRIFGVGINVPALVNRHLDMVWQEIWNDPSLETVQDRLQAFGRYSAALSAVAVAPQLMAMMNMFANVPYFGWSNNDGEGGTGSGSGGGGTSEIPRNTSRGGSR